MKTIFITGGSTGIGAATAKKFNQNNWRIIISSRNNKILNQTKKSIIDNSTNKEVYSIPCDISKRNEIHKVVKDIEKNIAPIDLALLNAAAYSPNKSQQFNIHNYNLLIDINLKGTLNCIEILQKQMGTRKKGHIAIVSSPAGYRGLPTAGAYGMTKAGLINLAESLYFDFKKIGIRVSVINPGFIKSASTNQNSFPMPFIKPALANDSIVQALWTGVVFGVVAYGTYNLTNMATVKNWSASIVWIDMLWGGVLTGFSSAVGIYLTKVFFTN